MAGWCKASGPTMRGHLQWLQVWGKLGVPEVEDLGAGRSPGPVGTLEESSEHDGRPGGTGRQYHRPDEPRMRPESAGQRTDTVQSPSAAPVGESHTQETSSGSR